jgi:hypothetical protein
MSNTSTAEFEAATFASPPAPIVLRNWPIWDEPLSAWPMLLAAAALAAAGALVTEALPVGAIIGLVFAVTLWRSWLPVWFDIGPRGVVEIVLGKRRRIAWNSIAQWRQSGKGVFLSPFSDAPLRAAMRGVYIFCGPRIDETTACLAYYLRATAQSSRASG